MNFKYLNNMTQDMLDVINDMNEEYMKFEFIYCHNNYLKAKLASEIQLPAIAATGEPVLHGARTEVYIIMDYWERGRDLIKKYLPIDWVENQGVNSWRSKL